MQLANYFGVSAGYLLDKTLEEDGVTLVSGNTATPELSWRRLLLSLEQNLHNALNKSEEAITDAQYRCVTDALKNSTWYCLGAVPTYGEALAKTIRQEHINKAIATLFDVDKVFKAYLEVARPEDLTPITRARHFYGVALSQFQRILEITLENK